MVDSHHCDQFNHGVDVSRYVRTVETQTPAEETVRTYLFAANETHQDI